VDAKQYRYLHAFNPRKDPPSLTFLKSSLAHMNPYGVLFRL
jgi:hypothetical protein